MFHFTMKNRVEHRLGKINWKYEQTGFLVNPDPPEPNFGIKGPVYVAGGVFLKEYNDIDIYPTTPDQFRNICKGTGTVLLRTPNAVTILDTSGRILQFCNYYHDSLRSLVNSFDYSHCQIGAKYCPDRRIVTERVYASRNFLEDMASERTRYTGSTYPLSSLIRAYKYRQRGRLQTRDFHEAIIGALCDIVKRGFYDYKDFKDQLDAVDLGLVPEDLKACENKLKDLYDLLRKDQIGDL